MIHFTEWISPLTNLLILYICGALGGIGGMYGAGKPITIAALGDAVFRGGVFGSGAGLLAMEKLSRPLAIVFAIFVGGGWLTKEAIIARLLEVLKSSSGPTNGNSVPPKHGD